MTDKQKLLEFINTYCNDNMTIEDIVDSYIGWHGQELSVYRLNDLSRRVNSHLICAISDMDRAVRVAHERATYLKCYLEGNMYADEEVARRCVDLQIENAKAILESTEKVAL